MEFRKEDSEMEVPLLSETKQKHALTEGSVRYIMLCEFFEGLAVKGLVAVMAIFFLEHMHYNENTAAELVHLFLLLSSGSYAIGSFISEAFMGNYNTALVFFYLQLGGLIMLTITSIADSPWRNFEVLAALLLIALGFAARPSFETFGCHQTMLSVERNVQAGGYWESGESRTEIITKSRQIASLQFFTTFYLITRIGYAAGAVISPEIRVNSAGSYFFVFLMCACAKALGILAFWSGRNYYYFQRPEIESGEQQNTLNLIEHNLANASYSKSLRRTGLEEAAQAATERSWEDWRTLMSAVLVLTPVVFFTALEYQTLSTWVFQARTMNAQVSWLGNINIPPDGMPVVSQFIHVLVVPVLDVMIYPFVNEHILKLTNLRKVVGSMLCTTVAFCISGALQISINSDLRRNATNNISILWQLPQYVTLAFGAAMMNIPLTEFAYHEAPSAMKSAVNGGFNTISGLGNGITILILAVLGPNASKVETITNDHSCGLDLCVLMCRCLRNSSNGHRQRDVYLQADERTEIIEETATTSHR